MVQFDSAPANAFASGVFIENRYRRNGLPAAGQRIALLAQYLAAKTPVNNVAVTGLTTADEVAQLAGYGSQAHMMAINLFAEMGSSPVPVDWFPIADGTTAKQYTVTFASNAGVAGVWRLYILGKRYEVAVAAGDTPTTVAAAFAALITADLSCVFTATANLGVVTLVAKWKGLSSDGLDVRKNYFASDVNLVPTTQTMVIASSVSGATDPSLTTAITNFGDTRYTQVVTALNDAIVAAAMATMWTTGIDPGVKRHKFGWLGFTGSRGDFLTAVGALNAPGAVYFPVEGSPSHPGQISAALAGMAAVSASADPARPWKNLVSKTLLPGTGATWTYAQMDAVVKAGGSTFKLSGPMGAVIVGDAVTTYKTNAGGAVDESWRFPEAITNTQRKEFDIDTMLNSSPFDRAKLIADTDTSSADYALSPKKIKEYFVSLYDSWVAENLSTSRDTAVDGMNVEINGTNSSRVDVEFTDYMVVGARIFAVKRNWSLGAAS